MRQGLARLVTLDTLQPCCPKYQSILAILATLLFPPEELKRLCAALLEVFSRGRRLRPSVNSDTVHQLILRGLLYDRAVAGWWITGDGGPKGSIIECSSVQRQCRIRLSRKLKSREVAHNQGRWHRFDEMGWKRINVALIKLTHKRFKLQLQPNDFRVLL